MQKKILMLGGSQFQLAPILYAKKRGHYVITCDYFPHNPGHCLSDEYHNISTTDIDAILAISRKLKINGIIAYASDPSAPTAAYVAEKMGLPGNPFQSSLILTDKSRFRDFLLKNNFNAPQFVCYRDIDEAFSDTGHHQYPMILKPVDSSGSKGVFLVKDKTDLVRCFSKSLSYSREKKVILEHVVDRDGYQIAGDGFLVNGKLAFRCFAQEHFSSSGNPFVPIGESFPLLIHCDLQDKIHTEIQRLVSLLNMKTGALNFDVIFNKVGEIFLMEIGPRNGGNFIPEVIRHATGIDLVSATVDTALDEDCRALSLPEKIVPSASYMIHSLKNGIFQAVDVSKELEKNILSCFVFSKPGEVVNQFNGSNDTIGCLLLTFQSEEEMMEKMRRIETLVSVIMVK
jgi:biotin carboxylase